MKFWFLLSFLIYFYGMSILVIEAGFNELLLVDAVVTSSKSVQYSNCKNVLIIIMMVMTE